MDLSIGLGLSAPRRAGAAPHLVPTLPLLDAHAATLAADFSRGRYALNGVAVPLSSVLAVSSGTKWVIDAAGTLSQVAADTPAFDWTSGRRRLLVEGAATNLVQHSDTLAAWTLGSGINVSPVAAGAFGGWTAFSFSEGTTGNQKFVTSASFSSVSGTVYVMSCYAKAETGRYFQITGSEAQFGSSQWATFDLTAGAVANVSTGTAYITAVGAGWYLCEFVVAATASASIARMALAASNGTSARGPAYTGTGKTVLIAALQCEVGTRASSRILTASAQASRIVDVAQLTPAAAATLQGAAASLVWRGKVRTYVPSQYVIGLIDNKALLRGAAASRPPTELRLDGSDQPTLLIGNVLPGEIGAALGWDGTGRAAAVNGAEAIGDASPVNRDLSVFFLGRDIGVQDGAAHEIDEMVAWPIRGSSSALQAQARAWE